MARKFGFKPTHKDILRGNDAAIRLYAGGREIPQELLNNVPPKRERAVARQLEAPVITAISELLAVHPRVIWAARFNSGMASYSSATGRYAPVWFHKFLRMPEKMRMPDFFGLMMDGRPFGLEAKRPDWRKPTDDREREQAAFLKMVRDAGGIGIFARSVDDVAEALK